MIYYIMGKSATGKDTIYKKLLSMNIGLKSIAIYTTRPKRDYEKEGVEYNFVDKKFIDDNKNKVIEIRTYHTVYGDWYYATLDDGKINDNDNYLMIGTLESYKKMKDYFGEDKIYPLYITLPNNIRYDRALEREKEQKIPKFEEMERRFNADEIDFSEENILSAGIKKRYENIDTEICIKQIIEDIKC